MEWIDLLIYFLAFGMAGVSLEVTLTAIDHKFRFKHKDLLLRGRSTIWMLFIYGATILIIIPIHYFFSEYSIFFRGIIYTALIYAWEYLSGFFLRTVIGTAPWNYAGEYPDQDITHRRINLHGLISLHTLPYWYFMSLFAELFYLFLSTHLIL